MRILTSFVLLCCVGTANAQVFTSSFEDWTGALPMGWFGDETTLAVDSAEQVSGDAHSGNYCVRLNDASPTNVRFTSQSVSLDSGYYYTFSYWAKGNGSVIMELYDANPFGGFVPDAWVTEVVNTTAWEFHTLDIRCYHTTTIGELCLRVHTTHAPLDIMIDDVSLSIVIPPIPGFHTIQQIQTTVGANQDSPYLDSLVTTSGVVTGINADGSLYYIQNGTGPFSGLCVHENESPLAVGDSVRISGTVAETDNLTGSTETNMYLITQRTVLASGAVVPEPELLNTQPPLNFEEWEGVLAHVDNFTCLVPMSGSEWLVASGMYWVFVGNYFVETAGALGQVYSITG
ncbi:MAG TPA: hypothetical protein PK760_06680, partial [Flavobacteriales bacterium]|nr:hypothetical protein [Flavobacteriales bacterium]